MNIILWILLIICLVVLLLFSFVWFCVQTVMGKRCMENPKLSYKTEKDFPGLIADPVSFLSGPNRLNGFWYHREPIQNCTGILIFVHGFGAGHHSYTTEINTFAKAGFLVLSYDQTGCVASEGKGIHSFYQGVKDLKSALAFIAADPVKSSFPVVIAGHSWGGYITTQAPSLKEAAQVRAIAAFSPMNEPALMLALQISERTKLPEKLLYPFVKVCLYLKDGSAALIPSSEILLDSTVPALIYHGDQDSMVPLFASPVGFPAVREKENIQAVICSGRSHNVYQSRESEQYLNATFSEIGRLLNQSRKKKEKEKAADAKTRLQQVYESIDYDMITQEDPEVMQNVIEFFWSHLG